MIRNVTSIGYVTYSELIKINNLWNYTILLLYETAHTYKMSNALYLKQKREIEWLS